MDTLEELTTQLDRAESALKSAQDAAAPFIKRVEEAEKSRDDVSHRHSEIKRSIRKEEERVALERFREEFPRCFDGTPEEFEATFYFDGWDKVTTSSLFIYSGEWSTTYFERMSTLTPRQIKYLCYKISGIIDFVPHRSYHPTGSSSYAMAIDLETRAGYMDYIEYLEEQSCAVCGILTHSITKCPTAPWIPGEPKKFDTRRLSALSDAQITCLAHALSGLPHPYGFFWFSRGDGCTYRHRQDQDPAYKRRALEQFISSKIFEAKDKAKRQARDAQRRALSVPSRK
jgi:hypothetical protein